jgi:hypothetical protein
MTGLYEYVTASPEVEYEVIRERAIFLGLGELYLTVIDIFQTSFV